MERRRRRSSLTFEKRPSLALLQKQASKLENAVHDATVATALSAFPRLRLPDNIVSGKRKAKALFCSAAIVVVSAAAAFLFVYNFHAGFRRNVQFWKGMGILGIKYKWTTFRAST